MSSTDVNTCTQTCQLRTVLSQFSHLNPWISGLLSQQKHSLQFTVFFQFFRNLKNVGGNLRDAVEVESLRAGVPKASSNNLCYPSCPENTQAVGPVCWKVYSRGNGTRTSGSQRQATVDRGKEEIKLIENSFPPLTPSEMTQCQTNPDAITW